MKIAALVLVAVSLLGTTAAFAIPILTNDREEPQAAAAQERGAEPRREAQPNREGQERRPADGERPAVRRDAARSTGLNSVIVSTNTSKKPHSVTVRVGDGVLLSFDLAEDAKLVVAGKPGNLADLKEGARVSLQFAADNRTVSALQAEVGERPRDGERPAGRGIFGAVSAVDSTKKTISVGRLTDGGGVGPATTYELADEVQIQIDRAPGTLAELADAKTVRLEVGRDGKVAHVVAEWAGSDDVKGKVKIVDAEKKQLTLTLGGEGRDGGVRVIGRDQVYTVAADAKIYISGQLAKLADLKPGQDVVLRQANDQVKAIRAVVQPPARDGVRREGAPREGAPREERPREQ